MLIYMKYNLLTKHRTPTIKLTAGLALLVIGLANLTSFGHVSATTYMTNASVIEYNMNASGTSSVALAFKAGAADSAGTLTVNFSGWTGAGRSGQRHPSGHYYGLHCPDRCRQCTARLYYGSGVKLDRYYQQRWRADRRPIVLRRFKFR